MTHCNFGEYFGCCKYGDDDCPAMLPDSEQNKVAVLLLSDWKLAVQEDRTQSGFRTWIADDTDPAISRRWQPMLASIYEQLNKD